MTYMEVRCCCQPMKLLGYLPVPMPIPTRVNFRWAELTIPAWRDICPDDATDVRSRIITLPIERICIADLFSYDAIKAEGMTLEELRKIPGFREVNNPPEHVERSSRGTRDE